MRTNTTRTGSQLVIGKCRNGHSVHGTWVDVKAGWIHCPCGAHAMAKGMDVKVTETKTCGARCTSSFGPACDCSCGGRNHGSDRRFKA